MTGPARSAVPKARIRPLNDAPVRPDGRFVLYWMNAFRRTRWNFSLQRAVEWARELSKPLLVLEPLRVDYPWASDRLHRFVLQGMADNLRRLRDKPVTYFPYVEPTPRAGKGLLASLSEQACVIVGDDFPAFFLPHMLAAAATRVAVRLEAVDSNGLLPVRAAGRAYPTAFAFRQYVQRHFKEHFVLPRREPLDRVSLLRLSRLPQGISARWSPANLRMLEGPLGDLPIDHSVSASEAVPGGSVAAEDRLRTFVATKLDRYAEDRNHPDRDGTSGRSPYLHFGHLSAHQIFAEVMDHEGWELERMRRRATGARNFFGVGDSAEAFLDQLVTWRELGYGFCAFRDDHYRYDSLPVWARTTLEEHETDPRPALYSLDALERAATADPLWNAAQTQLLREGRLHNTLRMLWGKRVLEWSRSPREAIERLITLNDKYALDGRDPNSSSGIFWVFGRFDRPWGPERPIFGKVRYMSSAATARKARVREYLQRYRP